MFLQSTLGSSLVKFYKKIKDHLQSFKENNEGGRISNMALLNHHNKVNIHCEFHSEIWVKSEKDFSIDRSVA